MMIRRAAVLAFILLWCGAAVARGQENDVLVETPVEALGCVLNLPEGFAPHGGTADTVIWIYRPTPEKKTSEPPGGGMKEGETKDMPAMTISVNRVVVTTPAVRELFIASIDADRYAASSSAPTFREVKELTVSGGWGYRYMETDKAEPEMNHRWIARYFVGNGVYALVITAPFSEFAKRRAVFDGVIGSFHTVSPKKK
jgi:hypothetical protein